MKALVVKSIFFSLLMISLDSHGFDFLEINMKLLISLITYGFNLLQKRAINLVGLQESDLIMELSFRAHLLILFVMRMA